MAIKVGKRKFKTKDEAIYYTVGLKKMTPAQAAAYIEDLEEKRRKREEEQANQQRKQTIEQERKEREKELKKQSERSLNAIRAQQEEDAAESRRVLAEINAAKEKRKQEIEEQKRAAEEKRRRQQEQDEIYYRKYMAEMKEKRADQGIAATSGLVSKKAHRPGKGKDVWWRLPSINNQSIPAVFQPYGAKGLAESYINLANPLTYQITAPSAPSFSVVNGWTFDGTANYLLAGNDAVTKGYPFSWIVLFKAAALSKEKTLISVSNYNATLSEYFFLDLKVNALGRLIKAGVEHLFTEADAETTTGYTANTWSVATYVGVNSTARYVYLNGQYKGSNTDDMTPTGLNTTVIGAYLQVDTYYQFLDGNIGAVAFYDVALQDDQVKTISDRLLNLAARG